MSGIQLVQYRIGAIHNVRFGSVTVPGFVRVVKLVINGEKPFSDLLEILCLTCETFVTLKYLLISYFVEIESFFELWGLVF